MHRPSSAGWKESRPLPGSARGARNSGSTHALWSRAFKDRSSARRRTGHRWWSCINWPRSRLRHDHATCRRSRNDRSCRRLRRRDLIGCCFRRRSGRRRDFGRSSLHCRRCTRSRGRGDLWSRRSRCHSRNSRRGSTYRRRDHSCGPGNRGCRSSHNRRPFCGWRFRNCSRNDHRGPRDDRSNRRLAGNGRGCWRSDNVCALAGKGNDASRRWSRRLRSQVLRGRRVWLDCRSSLVLRCGCGRSYSRWLCGRYGHCTCGSRSHGRSR